MKMTTLRDQSKPVLYALVVLFILAMGGFGNIFSSTNPDRGNSEFCDPELYIACSDDENINITVNEFNRRFNANSEFYIGLATFNNQFNAIDKQLDTLNAKDRVWNTILNERIREKFISDLELTPIEDYSIEMINFIKNYPNYNSNYKTELEKLDLFEVDSVFNQEKYELAVNDGTVDDKINESFAINYPGDAALNNSRGRTRWDDWLSTMKRQIATSGFNLIINSTQSISNLDLKNQLLLDSAIYDFDYLMYSIDTENNIDISDEEINKYYESIKDNNGYELKNDSKVVVEFVKWDATNLDGEKRDSVRKLAKDFRKTARKDGFETAIEKHNTFSEHHTVTLSNDFSTSKSGLSNQILKADSTTTPLYNIIGAGRRIINFAFSNEVGEIKLIPIESDRETGGINDIGIFSIKEIIEEDYISADESQIKDRIIKELTYKKKCELAKKDFTDLMNKYNDYLIEEGAVGENLGEFDLLDGWINNDDSINGRILLTNHKGSINEFLGSFINTDLKHIVSTNEEIKAHFLSFNKGLNGQIFAVDNNNIVMIRLNDILNMPDSEKMEAYKKSELQRLSTRQSNLFLLDQKETANIKDNRTLVY